MATATKETRRLGMHPNLLMDVIKRQAGTLHKAILEAVMNAIDASATEIRVDLSSTKLTVTDNGTGITDRAVIEQFWEMFGTPPQEGEQKTYGHFRMGRGQIISFGKNTWTTGPFQMVTDIEKLGLDYTLEQATTYNSTGCRIDIELYNNILPSDKAQTERELQVSVKYAPAKIYFNNELLTVDPDTVEWDHETEEAYIKGNCAIAAQPLRLQLGCAGLSP